MLDWKKSWNIAMSEEKIKSDSGSPLKRRNVRRKLKEKQNVFGTVKVYVQTEKEKIQIRH